MVNVSAIYLVHWPEATSDSEQISPNVGDDPGGVDRGDDGGHVWVVGGYGEPVAALPHVLLQPHPQLAVHGADLGRWGHHVN